MAEQYKKVLQKHERIVVLTFGDVTSTIFTRQRNVLIIEVPYLLKFGSYSFSFKYLIMLIRFAARARKISAHLPFPLIGEVLSIFWPDKTVITWHADVPHHSFTAKIISISHMLALKRVTRVIFTSEYFAEKYERIIKNHSVIPIWLDDESDGGLGIDRIKKKFALFLGRFGRYKGLSVLEEALKDNRLSEMNFYIVGQGDFLRPTLKKIQNVHIVERFVTEEEKRALIQDCYIFLFPSTDEGEAFGITQLEALREGKPVINTNLKSGVPFVSQHMISGLTVEPNDPQQLADAIYLLWNDSDLYEKLSTGAYERYSSLFSSDACKEKLKEAFGG